MESFPTSLIYALIGLAAGGIFGFMAGRTQLLTRNAELRTELEHEKRNTGEKLKLLENAKTEMTSTFQSLSLDALAKSKETFLSLAEARFKQLEEGSKSELSKREQSIKHMVEPLTKSLEKMDTKLSDLEKAREGAYGEIKQHMATMKQDQEKLRLETSNLVQALRSPSARGQWGEMQLKRTLEMAGMVEGVHYDQQVTTESGLRPDVIIRLPGGQSIIIDAKAPIEAFLDSFKDGVTPDERAASLDRHARHVREHIKALGSKSYWEQFDTPEFVVMFLPGESYFSAALERDPGLLEAGVDQKVIPASPTTLIALLRAVAYGWQQEKLAESAQEIAELGRDLYKRFCVFGDHLGKMGRGLAGALDSYNKAVGSLERNILPAARRFHELQGIKGLAETMPEVNQVIETTRSLSAPELVQDEHDLKTKTTRI